MACSPRTCCTFQELSQSDLRGVAVVLGTCAVKAPGAGRIVCLKTKLEENLALTAVLILVMSSMLAKWTRQPLGAKVERQPQVCRVLSCTDCHSEH